MCYKEFSWTPKDILELPDSEAERLSIIFEEKSAAEHRENKKLQRQSSHNNDDVTVEELPDE